MARVDVTTEKPQGGTATAHLSAQPTTEEAVGPQGFTTYDAMLLAMVAVWAVNPTSIKWALDYIDPLTFNALRFLLATFVPVGLFLTSKESLRWPKGEGWKLVMLGLIGHGIYQALFILAINNTLAGNVSLILSISPAFVIIFGAILGIERVRSYAWAGIGITLAGVLLVELGSGKALEFGPRLLGDFEMLVVTIIWALYTVLSQSYLKRYSSVKLNALTMPVGALFLLLVAAPNMVNTLPTWPAVPPMAWLILALSGLLAVSASYIVWYKGVQQLGPTRTSVYANLVPVLGALVSFFVLREPLGWPFWTGMVLVVGGVTLSRFGGRLVKSRAG
ncbi:MAG TPA: DMT family transporter [Chloroflexia bacterium]|nr:DMT family transporter [Chloroflexia bacterium]